MLQLTSSCIETLTYTVRPGKQQKSIIFDTPSQRVNENNESIPTFGSPGHLRGPFNPSLVSNLFRMKQFGDIAAGVMGSGMIIDLSFLSFSLLHTLPHYLSLFLLLL